MMFLTIPLPRLQERRWGIGVPLGELNNKNHFLFLKYTFSARLLNQQNLRSKRMPCAHFSLRKNGSQPTFWGSIHVPWADLVHNNWSPVKHLKNHTLKNDSDSDAWHTLKHTNFWSFLRKRTIFKENISNPLLSSNFLCLKVLLISDSNSHTFLQSLRTAMRKFDISQVFFELYLVGHRPLRWKNLIVVIFYCDSNPLLFKNQLYERLTKCVTSP